MVGTCHLAWGKNDNAGCSLVGTCHSTYDKGKKDNVGCSSVRTCYLTYLIGDISRPDTRDDTFDEYDDYKLFVC